MSFIRILDEQQTFTWSFTDPDTGEVFSDTVFTLRQLPRDVNRRLERQYTTTKWVRGQRRDTFDVHAFADASLDYCIVAWAGVTGTRTEKDGVVESFQLPCETQFKHQLPELVKSEIGRICFLRSVSGVVDDDEDAQSDPTKVSPASA